MIPASRVNAGEHNQGGPDGLMDFFPFVAEKVLNSKTIRSNSSGLSVGCGKGDKSICVRMAIAAYRRMSVFYAGVCVPRRRKPGGVDLHLGSGHRTGF